MAKAVTKKEKAPKAPTQKDVFMDAIGVALAGEFADMDVIRVKAPDTPECVLITAGDKDYTVTVTEKKKAVEYDEEDVRRNYTAEAEVNAE